MSIKAGTYITDGTAIWIIDDIRQGSVGDIKYSLVVPDGYLKLNGAAINKAEYPRLLKYVLDNNLYTTTSTNYILFYIESNNATTFRLPNYLNRCLEGGDGVNFLSAGLPNITGTIGYGRTNVIYIHALTSSGAFYPAAGSSTHYDNNISYTYNASKNYNTLTYLDASRSSSVYGNNTTVQPNAILLYPCIKY